MLVVIAIIGMLAALLLPELSLAKGYAKSASCKNHLHQMGIALQLYVNETETDIRITSAPPALLMAMPSVKAAEPWAWSTGRRNFSRIIP